MAEKELGGKSLRVIELFASTVDAMLQEFKIALETNDRQAIIAASSRLAQASSTMSAFFLGGAKAACENSEDIALANKMTKQTYDMMHRRLDAIAGKGSEPEAAPELPAAPNRNLN